MAALAVSSGQAASLAVQNLSRPVRCRQLDRSLRRHLESVRQHAAVHGDRRASSIHDPEAFRRATDGTPAPIMPETLPNPKLTVFPIGEVAAIGRELGVPLIMDNTAAPMICRPLEHGAAVVVHSTTKSVGYGTSIGGMIVNSGNFDWTAHEKRFPMFSEPEPSYHGVVWTEAVKPLGPIAYIIRARVVLLRDIGASMSHSMHSSSSRAWRPWLSACASIAATPPRSSCICIGIPLSRGLFTPACMKPEQRRRAGTYLAGGFGGLVGFELKGGREAGARFIDALKMFYHVANIGDARSLAIHPASTTHSQFSPADQFASGVTPGYVRLSVGIDTLTTSSPISTKRLPQCEATALLWISDILEHDLPLG